jgi:hypothetical protein
MRHAGVELKQIVIQNSRSCEILDSKLLVELPPKQWSDFYEVMRFPAKLGQQFPLKVLQNEVVTFFSLHINSSNIAL